MSDHSEAELDAKGNQWTLGLINQRRDAARWNMVTGGAVVTVAGAALQFSGSNAARLVAAIGITVALAAFIGVVWCWREVTRPGDVNREQAPYMMGIERDILSPLRRQGEWLAAEFVALAVTLAATLVTEAVSAWAG